METTTAENNRTKKIISVTFGVFLLLFVAVSVLAYLRRDSTGVEDSLGVTPTTSPQSGQADTTPAGFPEVTVNQWNLLGAASIAGKETASAALYPLKQRLTTEDYYRLTSKLGIESKISDENSERIIGGLDTEKESSIFYLQKLSGAFLFQATDGLGIESSSSSQLEPQRMQEFVNSLVEDPTVRLSATYKRKSAPDVTYYEFHRDWDIARLPIVNMMGLFNMPPTSPLSELDSLRLRAQIAESLETDEDIVSTTDTTDGRARSSDFNTLTVATRNGRIISVISKLRLPDPQKKVETATIISYAEAVKRLQANKYSQILTSPSGAGIVDHDIIYPKNEAILRSVTVTDSKLVYLEETPNTEQSQLAPYYVFGGYGVLHSGYRAKILAAVAASKNNVLSAATQKQGTFLQPESKITSVQTPTVRPTRSPTSQNNPTGVPQITTKCAVPPKVADLSNVQTDKNGIIFGQLASADPGRTYNPDREVGQWFIVPTRSLDVQQLSAVLSSFYSTVGRVKQRPLMVIALEYERASGDQCAVRITGESPTVFLYSDSPITAHLRPFSTTYADPKLMNGAWSVTIENSAVLNGNNETRDYLYYEYRRVAFDKPRAGWNIKKSSLAHLVNHLRSQLQLTELETERLAFEMNRASVNYRSNDTLYIGLIPQSEIDQKLPIAMVPEPDHRYRYHFYVSGEPSDAVINPPSLTPVVRGGLTMVEFGATNDN